MSEWGRNQGQAEMGLEKPERTFNPKAKDCLAPYINRTDEEVTELLEKLVLRIHAQGEYDQTDTIVLEFDQAADLVTIAGLLWTSRLYDVESCCW